MLTVFAMPIGIILGYAASSQYDVASFRVLQHIFTWVAECNSRDFDGPTFRAGLFRFRRRFWHEGCPAQLVHSLSRSFDF